LIKIDNISKWDLYKGISLEIKKDKIYFLSGNSGSGKSTLLKILTGFIPPNSGEIFLNGKNIDQYSFEQLRKELSLVPQDSVLYEGDLLANLKVGNDFRSESYDYSKSIDLINRLLPGKSMDDDPTLYSGGEQKRVSIVRSLIINTDFWLFDEPTTGLDEGNSRNVIETIVEYIKSKEKGCIIVTHDKSLLDLGDHTIFLENGEVKIDG
jgi:putative ABC transport system ATP-binding protein